MLRKKFDVIEDIRAVCFDLTGQSVEAAQYLINHPDEVAFASMREIARRADVPPVSLVRLAQRLGMEGYGELKQRFIETIREAPQHERSAEKRNEQSALALLEKTRAKNSTMEGFVDDFFSAESRVLEETRTHLTVKQAVEAAELLATAPKVFVCAKRTAYPAAFVMQHLLRKARPNVVFLDGLGGAPEGPLEDMSPQDVVVCFTFEPFNKMVHSFAARAVEMGAKVIAVTDSFSAPIGEYAKGLHFIVASSSRTFLESSVGAVSVSQLLCSLVIDKLGEQAQERIRRNERYLMGSGEYLLGGDAANEKRPTRRLKKA